MKRILVFFIIFVMFILLIGCESIARGRSEINDLEFVRAIAIDTSPVKEGYVRLTISSQKMQPGGDGKTGQKESTTVYSEGRTVFEAIRNFYKHFDKRPFFGHLEYIIIGEDAAKDGIYKYMDFFSRDHEVRLNLKVFVLKGDRAEHLMEKGKKENQFVFDRLRGLIESLDGQSVSNLVNLIEVMYILDVKYLSLYIPCIEMVKVAKDDNKDNDTMDIEMAGFSIFNRDKLAGYVDDKMARGLNWLMNKIQSGIIVVKSPDGTKISLEIIDSGSKLQPRIENGNITITVKVGMSSNIGEIQSPEDIFDSTAFTHLERQQEEIIRQEIENVIKYAQEMGFDFFSAGMAVSHKYPILWEDKYEKNWKAVFPKVKFNVNVDSKINRTYDIKQPNAAEEGDK